jgi:hypothetical protein
MVRRLAILIACWVAAGGAAIAPGGADPPTPARIVAIGDLHGDFAVWRAIAVDARLIDRGGKWIGGKTVLVQGGDIVDRAPDSLKIIRDLMRLEKEARRAGGQVIVLIGNHEAMMMTGDLRYVDAGEFAAFAGPNSEALRERVYQDNRRAIEAAARKADSRKRDVDIKREWLATMPLGKLEHQAAWSPRGELGRWTLGHRAVVRVGDSLFVHGGISSAYASISINDINRQVAEALTRQDQNPKSIINDPLGPLWYRGLVTRDAADEPPPPAIAAAPPAATGAPPAAAQPPRPSIAEEIALVQRAYGVRRIVVAHTPSKAGIIGAANGALWRIDSANSRAYGGRPSWLDIAGDKVTAHSLPRP